MSWESLPDWVLAIYLGIGIVLSFGSLLLYIKAGPSERGDSDGGLGALVAVVLMTLLWPLLVALVIVSTLVNLIRNAVKS